MAPLRRARMRRSPETVRISTISAISSKTPILSKTPAVDFFRGRRFHVPEDVWRGNERHCRDFLNTAQSESRVNSQGQISFTAVSVAKTLEFLTLCAQI